MRNPIAGSAILLLCLPLGASWAGPRTPAVPVSARTLSVGIEIDRDRARLLSFTVKDRPFRGEDPAAPRPHSQGRRVQVEVTLQGPSGKAFIRRVDVGPLCLVHGPDSPPHVEGDTIRVHRDAFLVEMPELEGFDRLEVAIHDVAFPPSRRALGRERLDADRFTPAGGPFTYDGLAFSDPGAPEPGSALTSSSVLWPVYFDDPDIYRIYGNPAEGPKRINITIVPDGYTYAEKALMESHADAMVNHFRAKTPYAEHDSFTNYTLVYAYSLETGTDECDCGVVLDTAMGTRFPSAGDPCGGSANRCLYYGGGGCDTSGNTNIVAAEQRAPVHDTTIVMVNTTRYGGCGGARAVYSAGNPAATEVAVHELGHTLAGLADEYDGNPGCGSGASGINTSTDPINGAWSEWISEIGPPREGAQYYNQCIYRPLDNCEMRALNQPFCPVCNQRWSLVVYGHPRVAPTAPIEAMAPASPTVVPVGLPSDFYTQTRLSSGPTITNEITWTISGPGYPLPTVVATGTTSLQHTFAQEGLYTLTCEVVADTNFVKPSKYGANQESVSWAVEALPPAGSVPDGSAFPGVPLTLTPAPGGDLTLSWGDSCSTADADFAIYEGTVGDFMSHVPVACGTGGLTTMTLTPAAGDRYYLVVPLNGTFEGSHGTDSTGAQRSPGAATCLPAAFASCP